jgi:hypothetical protein
MPVKKWKDREQKEDGWMWSWVKGTKTQTSEKEGKDRKYERCMTEEIPEYLGREGQKEEKWWRDLDVGTRREKTDIGRKKRKEGADCARRSEMRERERKERGEIQNEDGREIKWMKEIWKRKKRIGKERGEGC